MSLLINGKLIDVPGVRTLAPDSLPWVHLSREDGKIRAKRKPQQAIIHKTIADDPEVVVDDDESTPDVDEGVGPAKGFGGAQYTAEYWQGSSKCSGAHLVTGFEGTTACLEDLVIYEAWHGNQANDLSYGHEIKEGPGGKVYMASLLATLEVTLVATSEIGIQWQCPIKYVKDKPLTRFKDGGKTLVGILGHRDITTNRGYWDPGDTFFRMARARGVEAWDFEAKQDIDVWSRRQEWLKAEGYYTGTIDGIPWIQTTEALKKAGYPGGIFARWRELAERPPMPG